jgi:hypothetical protein
VAGCCECGDEPSGSCATVLVNTLLRVYRTDQFSVVSGYGLDDQAIEVRSPAEAKGVFL